MQLIFVSMGFRLVFGGPSFPSSRTLPGRAQEGGGGGCREGPLIIDRKPSNIKIKWIQEQSPVLGSCHSDIEIQNSQSNFEIERICYSQDLVSKVLGGFLGFSGARKCDVLWRSLQSLIQRHFTFRSPRLLTLLGSNLC